MTQVEFKARALALELIGMTGSQKEAALAEVLRDWDRMEFLCHCTAGQWEELNNIRLSKPKGYLREAVDKMMADDLAKRPRPILFLLKGKCPKCGRPSTSNDAICSNCHFLQEKPGDCICLERLNWNPDCPIHGSKEA